MSFASPLGLGATGMSEYMDVSVESFIIAATCEDRVGDELTINEWINRLNERSTDMIYITGIYVLPEKIKPSMSLLAACSYELYNMDPSLIADVISYYKEAEEIIYVKQTKKSVKEIDLKAGILAISDNIDDFISVLDPLSVNDVMYLSENVPDRNGLLIMCLSGSELNIKPEMLIEKYAESRGIEQINAYEYDLERIEMYGKEDKYISLSIADVSNQLF